MGRGTFWAESTGNCCRRKIFEMFLCPPTLAEGVLPRGFTAAGAARKKFRPCTTCIFLRTVCICKGLTEFARTAGEGKGLLKAFLAGVVYNPPELRFALAPIEWRGFGAEKYCSKPDIRSILLRQNTDK